MTFRGRIAVIADGDPLNASTNSGVARGITTALTRSLGDARVITIDGSLSGLRRIVLSALTFRPSRRRWFIARNAGLLNIVWRSLRRERKSHEADLILHVRNIYLPSRRPYAVFIDSTTNMSQQAWSEWRPWPPLERARRLIETWYYRRAELVFTAGPQAAEDVIGNYGVARAKVAAIGGGVNFDVDDVAVASNPRVSTATEPVILFVGRDYHRKGGDLILAAFDKLRAEYSQARLLFVGCRPPGPVPAGVDVIPDVLDRQEMAELYRRADVFCLPTRHEPYGLVILEAMAFGLPVVATAIGAIPAIVEHERSGLIVPPSDEQALVSALTYLVSDEEARARYSGRAHDVAMKEHTWDRVAERMLERL